jgi:dienelactone hydrolase
MADEVRGAKHGDLVGSIEDRVFVPTGCSPRRGRMMPRRLMALVPFTLVLAGCADTISGPSLTTTVYGFSQRIPVAVSRPAGPGPFPAIVIMHDCSGVGPASSGAPGRWARELIARGYVVVVPDSFTPRGHPGGVCTVPLSQRRADVSPERRAHDAHAALAYARTLPGVDGRRVGIMGGSHGGSTTLAAMLAPESDPEPPAREQLAGFAAGVALYPRCAIRSGAYRPVAPLLILIGDKDDWTPAEPCRKLVDTARQAGHPVAIKVYPGAHHAFDSPNPVRYVAARINPNAPGGRGATTGGDPAAWADSIREVVAFFDRHLERTAGPRADGSRADRERLRP